MAQKQLISYLFLLIKTVMTYFSAKTNDPFGDTDDSSVISREDKRRFSISEKSHPL